MGDRLGILGAVGFLPALHPSILPSIHPSIHPAPFATPARPPIPLITQSRRGWEGRASGRGRAGAGAGDGHTGMGPGPGPGPGGRRLSPCTSRWGWTARDPAGAAPRKSQWHRDWNGVVPGQGPGREAVPGSETHPTTHPPTLRDPGSLAPPPHTHGGQVAPGPPLLFLGSPLA